MMLRGRKWGKPATPTSSLARPPSRGSSSARGTSLLLPPPPLPPAPPYPDLPSSCPPHSSCPPTPLAPLVEGTASNGGWGNDDNDVPSGSGTVGKRVGKWVWTTGVGLMWRETWTLVVTSEFMAYAKAQSAYMRAYLLFQNKKVEKTFVVN